MLTIEKKTFIENDLYLIFNKNDINQLIDTSKIYVTSSSSDSNYYEVHIPMIYKGKNGNHKYQYDFGFKKIEDSYKLVLVYTTP